jgi:succinoglycan biosynthesis transport protein ExoP
MHNAGHRFDFRDYVRLFQKRKWLILAVFVAAVAAGFGLTRLQEPAFQATSIVIVKSAPRAFYMISGNTRLPESLSLETQASRAQSGRVAQKAFTDLTADEFGKGEAGPKKPEDDTTNLPFSLADVQASLSARPSEPDLILIQATTSDPQLAMRFARAAADAFVEVDNEDSKADYTAAQKWIQDQVDGAEKNLVALERQVLAEQKELGIVNPEAEASELATALASYRGLKAEAQAEHRQAEGEATAIRKELGSEPPVAAVSTVAPDPAAQELEKQLAEKRAELLGAKAKYNPSYSLVVALEGEVADLEADYQRLQGAHVRKTQYLPNPLHDQLRQQLAAASARADGLQQRVSALNAIVDDYASRSRAFPEKQAKLRRLLADAEAQRTAYADLKQRLLDAEMNQTMQQGNIKVLDYPPRAVQVAPQTQKALIFAALVGAISGFAIAFMLELLDNTVRVAEDLTGEIAIPFLGMVPYMADGAANMLVTATAPKSPPAEAYRALRSNINFALVDDANAKSFLVTSAGATEGKSVTAANLAVVLAQAQYDVLIVDTDLRRPKLHRFLEVEGSPGLTNVLTGDYTIDQVIQQTAIPKLRFIASGPLPPNPSELLGSKAMADVLERLESVADYVIFDSPPAVVLTDAIVLSARVDKTILVAESARVTREAFAEMKRLVESAKGQILGVVINKLRLSPRDYYYYYYYYDYGSRRRGDGDGRPKNGRGPKRQAAASPTTSGSDQAR